MTEPRPDIDAMSADQREDRSAPVITIVATDSCAGCTRVLPPGTRATLALTVSGVAPFCPTCTET